MPIAYPMLNNVPDLVQSVNSVVVRIKCARTWQAWVAWSPYRR